MDDPQIKFDTDGIPILDDVVDPDAPEAAETLLDEAAEFDDELLDRLSDDPGINELLDDITADLQSLVTWKIEEFIKQEITQVIHEAANRAAPQLAEGIRAQLRQALPALLAEVLAHRNR